MSITNGGPVPAEEPKETAAAGLGMSVRNRVGLYGAYFLGMAGIGFALNLTKETAIAFAVGPTGRYTAVPAVCPVVTETRYF